MKHEKVINQQRNRRRYRVRNKVKRFSTRPRMSVFRSAKHIFVQIIDDASGKTLAAVGSMDKELRADIGYGGNQKAAVAVGKAIAAKAADAGVKQVAFDRRDYRYHGRVAALADAARDAGLDIGAKKEVVEAKKPEAKKSQKKQKNPKKSK